MTGKMTVASMTDTGHILGAATRDGDPESKFEIEELIGGSFPIRDSSTGKLLLSIEVQGQNEASRISASVVNFSKSVFSNPHVHTLVDGEITPLDKDVKVDDIVLSATQVEVTLSDVPSEDIEVRVQVEGGPTNSQFYGEKSVAGGANKVVNVPILGTLQNGDYAVVAFATGYVHLVKELSIPTPP